MIDLAEAVDLEPSGEEAPTRPALRYHGGKWRIAPWIISWFPAHRIYVEPYGGGASVLLRKARVYCEVYNDLDEEIVHVMRMLQDRDSNHELRRRLRYTPFARSEFMLSYEPTLDPVERARRTIVRSFMGYGSASTNPNTNTGFRTNSNRSGTSPAHEWVSYSDRLSAFWRRLQGVVLENRPAEKLLAANRYGFSPFDRPETLYYVDPPYLASTRSVRMATGKGYKHEITADDHVALAAHLRKLGGMVIVSGYRSEMYDELYAGWTRVESNVRAHFQVARTECLWINPAAYSGARPLRLGFE